MNLESKNQENQSLVEKPKQQEIKAWENLTNLEKNCVVALILSNSIVEAQKKFKSMTGKGNWVFYKTVYPSVKDTWKSYSTNISDLALMRLRAGSLDAVDEMLDEVKHYDVEIRHKASKVIIENVVAPKKDSGGNTFNAPVQINVDKYIEE